ncbi:PREDICTED: jerky protein homolog-like [Cyphomyrmex costatus]|uniref:jerky protein homolog-like n=1 Tax=Cyphomyrmex costatus TaxID=456900 RepID=UPI0008523003|nr:PREDICTED: jerky protein homolog-like [Cyphomyrmex costatus]
MAKTVKKKNVTKKRQRYNQTDLDNALSLIKKGLNESMANTVKKKNVTKKRQRYRQADLNNALSLIKNVLNESMAETVKKKNVKKRQRYSQTDLDNALSLIKKGSTSLRKVSQQYKIPKSTLSLKNRGDRDGLIIRPGPKPILPIEDENKIVTWILERFDAKCPVTKTQLLDNVKLYLDINKEDSLFKDNRPGRHWFESFLKRHPQISKRMSKKRVSNARNKATEGKIRAWFTEIQHYLELKNLINVDPSRVFNCDESAFFLHPSGDRVLARKGSKMVHKVIDGSDKETLTVLYTVNAAGTIPPPMIVYWYSRIPFEVSSKIPKEWSFGCTEEGWMTSKSFYEYITNVFYPWLLKNKIKFPIILYLDGHSSHLTMPLSEFCRDKGIEVIALPPNATHLLQPLDVGFFGPLKKNWSKAVNDWKFLHPNVKFQKSEFAPLLKKTTDSMNFQSIAKNAFRVCGLFPLDSNVVPYNKLGKINFDQKSNNDEEDSNVVPYNKLGKINFDQKSNNDEEDSNVVPYNKLGKINFDQKSNNDEESENTVSDEIKEFQKHLVFFEKNLSNDILSSFKECQKLGLHRDKTDFYDTLTNNEIVLDNLENDITESVLFEIILPSNDEINHFNTITNQENTEKIEIPPSNEIFPNLLIENTISEPPNIEVSSEATMLQDTQNEGNLINIYEEGNLQKKDIENEETSIFKEIFIWPIESQTSKSTRRIDKIPSVVTSDEWNKYQRNKEEEKLFKQKELQDKRETRKRLQKEKAEEKAKKK